MKNNQLHTLEKHFIALREDIKMRASELELDIKKEEVRYYKDESDFISDITPLPIEQNKKRITAYTVESIFIVLLAIGLIVIQFIFKR